MGLMDRDYWKEKHRNDYVKNTLSTENSTEYLYINQNKSKSLLRIVLEIISLILITSILILTMRSSDKNNSLYITNKVCETTKIIIDANQDGIFTYKDIGPLTLDLFELPLKLLLLEPSLKPALKFFELKSNDCVSYFGMIANEIIWVIILLSIIFLLNFCKFIIKLILYNLFFKIIRISAFKRVGQVLFRLTYPCFEFDLHINLILYFVVGLGITFFLKTHYELFHANSKPINYPTVIPEILIKK